MELAVACHVQKRENAYLKNCNKNIEFVVPCSLQNSLNYYKLGLPAGRAGIIMLNCVPPMYILRVNELCFIFHLQVYYDNRSCIQMGFCSLLIID